MIIGKNALPVAQFEELPQAQIGPTSKYLCAHLMANDKTIILSTENVLKVHFEKRRGKIGQNALTGTLFKQLPSPLQAQVTKQVSGPQYD